MPASNEVGFVFQQNNKNMPVYMHLNMIILPFFFCGMISVKFSNVPKFCNIYIVNILGIKNYLEIQEFLWEKCQNQQCPSNSGLLSFNNKSHKEFPRLIRVQISRMFSYDNTMKDSINLSYIQWTEECVFQ